MRGDRIILAHGSGGAATSALIREVFADEFDNEILDAMEDAAVLPVQAEGRKVLTTDSFVVDPVIFRGGDLGRLAVCGTVNDLLMRGAKPLYITSAWILEEGAEIETLRKLVHSMAQTVSEAGVQVVCGDTKVIGGHGGIYANTTGIGVLPTRADGTEVKISASASKPGDVVIVSGNLGDHHAAILSERMSIDTDIRSDVAPLTEMVLKLIQLDVHTLRDVTRGGLATVCKELSEASKVTIELEQEKIPVDPKVRDFSKILGLDPLYMGNEGKLVCIVAEKDADQALDIIRNSKYGDNATIIGTVTNDSPGSLYLRSTIGGKRELDVLQGEGLPRIC